MTYEERKARLHEIRTAGIGGRKRFDIDDVCFLSGEVSRLEAELERVEAERDAAILKRDDAQHFLDLMGPQLVAARAEAEALRKKLNEVDEDAVRELDTLRAEAEALRRKLEVQNEYESERNKGLWSEVTELKRDLDAARAREAKLRHALEIAHDSMLRHDDARCEYECGVAFPGSIDTARAALSEGGEGLDEKSREALKLLGVLSKVEGGEG